MEISNLLRPPAIISSLSRWEGKTYSYVLKYIKLEKKDKVYSKLHRTIQFSDTQSKKTNVHYHFLFLSNPAEQRSFYYCVLSWTAFIVSDGYRYHGVLAESWEVVKVNWLFSLLVVWQVLRDRACLCCVVILHMISFHVTAFKWSRFFHYHSFHHLCCFLALTPVSCEKL